MNQRENKEEEEEEEDMREVKSFIYKRMKNCGNEHRLDFLKHVFIIAHNYDSSINSTWEKKREYFPFDYAE